MYDPLGILNDVKPKNSKQQVDPLGILPAKKKGVGSSNGARVGISTGNGQPLKEDDLFKGGKTVYSPELDAYAKIQEEADPLLSAQRKADIVKGNRGKLDEFAKSSKQARDINDVLSGNGYMGNSFVSKLINDNPDKYSLDQLQQKTQGNVTAQSALKGIADKRKVDDAINTTTDPYRAAIKYATGKENESQDNIPDEQKGEYVSQFLNNPNVIARTKTDPQFSIKYKEAKFNWMNDFPDAAQKDIKQKIGQHLENTGQSGWLYNNPGKEKVDKAVDDLVKSGDLDAHQAEIYKTKIRPDVGTFKSLMLGSPIPTADVVNTFTKSLEKNGGNLLEGLRDVTDKISLGTISALGEGRDEHQKRILEDEYSQPQVQAKSGVQRTANNIVDMVGFATPAILGSMADVPAMATMGFQFEGGNRKTAMELYPDDKNKQDAYTALTTAVDLVAGQKLPIEEASNTIKSLIDDAATGEITKEAAKNKFTNFATNFVTNTVSGANALALMKLGHNAADAVFGGKNIDVEEQAKQLLQQYPQDLLSMAFFGGVGAAKHLIGKVSETEIPKTLDDVHAAAKDAGVDINTDEFKNKSKELTGEEHLDNMTPQQLGKINDFIQSQKTQTDGKKTTLPNAQAKGKVEQKKEGVEQAPSLDPEKLFNEKLSFDQKYKKVDLDDEQSGEIKNMSVKSARGVLEKQHNILDKLINCLTT